MTNPWRVDGNPKEIRWKSLRNLDFSSIFYRRFRGDRTACPPPVTGRSASFRLRFRFVRVVRAVRAGEAKLRGRMQTVVLIAGPPGCEYPCVLCCSGRLFA